MLETVEKLIEQAASNTGISHEQTAILLEPEQVHEFDVAIEMDTGAVESFPAFRVQHSSILGPYKGGIRFDKNVSLEEVKALASLMALKTSAVGLPLGGGKGGIKVDPDQLSQSELESLSRQYVRELAPHIGPEVDIPAPDMNTNSQTMDWMADEYSNITDDPDAKASFTGKSLDNFGSRGREQATGRGGCIALAHYLKRCGLIDQQLTVAVQGLGNVGYWFAKLVNQYCQDVTVIALADSRTCVKDSDGIDIETAIAAKRGDDLTSMHSAEISEGKDILTTNCDILVLAATENVITADNQQAVKASFVLELANGPVDFAAGENLFERGVTVIPDVIANAGGVIVSYLEWVQNLEDEYWDEGEVNQRLLEIMNSAMTATQDHGENNVISLKLAAFELALKRLSSETASKS